MLSAAVARLAKPSEAAPPARNSSPTRRLHDAAAAGDIAGIDALVAAHPHQVSVRRDGLTPLERAARRDDPRTVLRLVHHGALPFCERRDGRGAVTHAAASGHVDNVRMLLPFGPAPYAELARLLDGPAAGEIPPRSVAPLLEIHGALPATTGLRSLGSAHGAPFVRDLLLQECFVADPQRWRDTMLRVIALEDAPLLQRVARCHPAATWSARTRRTSFTQRDALSGPCAAAMLRAWCDEGRTPAPGLEDFASWLQYISTDPAANYLGGCMRLLLAARREREADAEQASRTTLLDRVAALVWQADEEVLADAPAPSAAASPTPATAGGDGSPIATTEAAALAAEEARDWQNLLRQLDATIHSRPDDVIYPPAPEVIVSAP